MESLEPRGLRAVIPCFALLLVATTACGDATGTRVAGVEGSLTVTLDGAVNGEYEARGVPPVPPTDAVATFAVAVAAARADDVYGIAGFRASGADQQDVIQLELSGVRGTGDYPISGDVVIALDDDTSLPEQVFSIMTGTVRVTALSATRIVGEFSGTAVGGGFPPAPLEPPSDTVYLSGGRFDVPIIRR